MCRPICRIPDRSLRISFIIGFAKFVPEIRNRVLGYLMPAIFIEARDLVMTGKVLKMIKPMADVQSDFFIAAESKINLLTVMINYRRLIKEQAI